MKKGWFLLSWTLALCLLLIWCTNNGISKKEAQNIALADANWTRSDVVFTKTEYNRENKIYEIEFTAIGEDKKEYEYEYEIDAKNGEIKIDEDFAVWTDVDAQKTAFTDAGYTEDMVTLISNNPVEIEDKAYYRVKFVDEGGKMCDYTISAIDGTIYDSDCKQTDYREKDDVE